MPRIGEPTAAQIARWVEEAATKIGRALFPQSAPSAEHMRLQMLEHAASWLEVDQLSSRTYAGVHAYLRRVALTKQAGFMLDGGTLTELVESRVEAQLMPDRSDRWAQVRSYIRAGIRVRSHKRRTGREGEA